MEFIKTNWKEFIGLAAGISMTIYSIYDLPAAWPATLLFGSATIAIIVLLTELYEKQKD